MSRVSIQRLVRRQRFLTAGKDSNQIQDMQHKLRQRIITYLLKTVKAFPGSSNFIERRLISTSTPSDYLNDPLVGTDAADRDLGDHLVADQSESSDVDEVLLNASASDDTNPGNIEEDPLITQPENVLIWLPSNDPLSASPSALAHEVAFRVGEAMEALKMLRLSIGQKSVMLRFIYRRARSHGQKKRGRAWNDVNLVHADLEQAWGTYKRSLRALHKLPQTEQHLKILRPILESDLKVLNDITEPNRTGQRSDTIAWFWQVGSTHDGEETDWQMEGKSMPAAYLSFQAFYVLKHILSSASKLVSEQSSLSSLGRGDHTHRA